MKNIKKKEIWIILLAAIIVSLLTIGVVKAVDWKEVEGLEKGAIGKSIFYSYDALVSAKNTYCIQHPATLQNPR